jgi:hypothetical protein
MPMEVVRKIYRTYKVKYEDIVGCGLKNILKIESRPLQIKMKPKTFQSFSELKNFFVNEALEGRTNIVIYNASEDDFSDIEFELKEFLTTPPITIDDCELIEVYFEENKNPQPLVQQVQSIQSVPLIGQQPIQNPPKEDNNLKGIEAIMNALKQGINPTINVPLATGHLDIPSQPYR